MNFSLDASDAVPSSPSARPSLGGASAVWKLYPPLSDFFEDVPCDGIPVLKKGSEVHLKFGANVLMLSDSKKHVVWRPWMNTDQNGYLRSMGFSIEKRKERRSVARRSSFMGGLLNSSPADDQSMGPDDGCIGLAFALRSTLTKKYISDGGMFDRCLQVAGDRPEDACIFTIVPMPSATTDVAAAGGEKSDVDYRFALRLLSDSKYLSIRKDGYVHTTSVADDERDIDSSTMAASMEYLVPRNSYEITVHDDSVGLTVGRSLPLCVVDFTSVRNAAKGGHAEPGPAERTGRVHIGDVITTVNGQDISGFPRADVLRMISCKRPVTLGFAIPRAQ